MPLLAGGALELPLGMLASGPRRRLAVLGGGIVFILSLAAVAGAQSFAVLLCAFTVFFPASGAFVSLTQAELMDAWPGRRATIMARWDLAGSAGAVAGPLLLTVVLAGGGSWRAAYLVLAAVAAVTWVASCLRTHDPPAALSPAPGEASAGQHVRPAAAGSQTLTARIREVVALLRDGPAARWLWLAVVADLLVDVLTGFLALYLVDVAHLRPELAALAIAVRFGSGLAGDAALVLVLERVPDLVVLRATAAAAALLYPAFLLVPGAAGKLAIMAALSAATAPWYPLLQARLYGSLPGRSSVAVTLSSAAGLAGGLGPLAVGLIAERAGLPWALGVLAVVPAVILAFAAGSRGSRPAKIVKGESRRPTAEGRGCRRR